MAVSPPQLVKFRAGLRGSGWAVGRVGVLTALHVLELYLADPFDAETNSNGVHCRAVCEGADGTSVFECEVVWSDAVRDLALLRVATKEQKGWEQRLVDQSPTVFAAPSLDPILGVSAVGFPEATVDDVLHPDPEQAFGDLLPAGGPAGRMNFDVDTFTPDDSVLWQGFSGAALREATPERRLLAIVTKRVRGPHGRRLVTVAVPDPDLDPGWAAALQDVGADPVVEDFQAPTARRFLSCLDRAGRPWRVRAVPSLKDFGTRTARVDISPPEEPYFPFLNRPEYASLATAIDAALNDQGAPRIILLSGPSAAGKSRLAAEVLRAHDGLAQHRFISPFGPQQRRLGDLPEPLYRHGRVLLWLDNIHQHLKLDLDHERAQLLLANPQLILVGTALKAELHALTDAGAATLREFNTGGGQLIADDTLVRRIDFNEPDWGSHEDPHINRAVEAAARANVSLGEYLAAYTQLTERYRSAGVWEKALIDMVTDWSRTGMVTPMPEPDAERLWINYLTTDEASSFARKAEDDQRDLWVRARDDATSPVLGSSALLERTRHGLLGNEAAHAQRASTPIPYVIWEHVAKACAGDPSQAESVALNAAEAGHTTIAADLWQTGTSIFAASNLRALGSNFLFTYFPVTDWRRFFDPAIVFGQSGMDLRTPEPDDG